MRTATDLPDDEKQLNQLLCRYIREALWLLRASDTGFDHAPHLDASNQPDLKDTRFAQREEKRPDFQWELKDVHARTREEYQKFYAMECKRLGLPTSANWILNENYVTMGVRRFLRSDYGYGSPKSNPSASMIGYVQTMDLVSIFEEVNHYCSINSVTQLSLSETGWKNGLSFLNQILRRPEIHAVGLVLRHIWTDLRNIPVVSNKIISKKKRKQEPEINS